jgi:hypothetical protein
VGEDLAEHDPEKWIPVFGQDHAPFDALARRGASAIAAATSIIAAPVTSRHVNGSA